MKIAGIYRVTNIVTGRSYVGQSIDVHRRWKGHLQQVARGRKTKLYCAIRAYGIESFAFVLLEQCVKEELDARERYWVETLGTQRTGYNLTAGGNVPDMTDEIKAKLRGQKRSLETRALISASKMGRPAHNKGKKGPPQRSSKVSRTPREAASSVGHRPRSSMG